MEIYDDEKAIAYIRQAINPEIASAYDDDEFYNVIDMIMDWYEENDMLDAASDTKEIENDADALADAITAYVTRQLARDKEARLSPAHVRDIVAAELAYENSLIDF